LYRVNRYVKGFADSGTDTREVLDSFTRWPTWMWANEEVVELAEWLRRHNTDLPDDRKVGFYGLDVYSLWDSLYAVLGYLRRVDPSALPTALRAQDLRRKEPRYAADGREEFCAAEQNALVVKDAEAYYRAMVRGGPQSWNIRDRHMTETLERLVRHHGPGAGAIVWEHNTHIGDARYTDMVDGGMVNVGQLMRERHLDEGWS
jgi:erythromycin esterase